MLNEWDEFLQYTGKVSYVSANKNDNTYLGRFTFDTILKFEGLSHVLTIIARGFLFHDRIGALAHIVAGAEQNKRAVFVHADDDRGRDHNLRQLHSARENAGFRQANTAVQFRRACS